MSKAIDKNLKDFVHLYVDSLVAWAVIVFYHENPSVRDRVTDLARHLGRREDDIARAVEELAVKGLLKKEEIDGEAIFVYEPDSALREQVNSFVDALDSRDLRLWILAEVLDR
ncbi:MAG: hypothetical protein K6T91_02330 [Firmicutes bacterium]|nr:hypothetical protein [Bacillota bacterium]